MDSLGQVMRNFPVEDGKRMMTQTAPILCNEGRPRYQKYTVIPCCPLSGSTTPYVRVSPHTASITLLNGWRPSSLLPTPRIEVQRNRKKKSHYYHKFISAELDTTSRQYSYRNEELEQRYLDGKAHVPGCIL